MTPRERFQWIAAVMAAPNLTAGTRLLAARLAMHVNGEDGRCDPSVATLAREVAMSTRWAAKSIADLIEAGWIERRSSRGRHANSYSLRLDLVSAGAPDEEPANGETLNASSGMSASTTKESSGLTLSSGSGLEPRTLNQSVANPEEFDIEPRSTVHPNIKGRIKNREETLPLPPQTRSLSPAQGSSLPGVQDDFSRWWSAYPRHDGEAGARREFNRVIGSGEATVAELLAGALRYAAGRQGEPARFTKLAENWLRSGHWKDQIDLTSPRSTENRQYGGFSFTEYARETIDPIELAREIAMWGRQLG
ncbi:Uncharacterised protein [Starkeya nomas]|uniref:Helix-turn-helix domain-containing protein n=1 Tax=Starkeya nomas TaxID=2666134 RepID=A0A5S9P0X9_9HYPH|nr:helix-turn-helix domain-containing protein [Starkeya nomas]CAA0096899.1 Uncharacterised protein [Starkeya nomas]